MSTLPARLQDQEYGNWIRSSLCLAYTKEGLETFADSQSKILHAKILANLSRAHLTGTNNPLCNHNFIRFGKNNNLTYTCGHQYCKYFLRAVIQEGIDRVQKFELKPSNMANTNVQHWDSSPWEIAKLFMNAGQKPGQSNPSDTDLSGILNFISHCKVPRNAIANAIMIDKVREARNAIMHTKDMKVTAGDFNNFTASMTNLLNDPAIQVCPRAQTAAGDIQTVVSVNFQITFEDETKAFERLTEELCFLKVNMLEKLEETQKRSDTDTQELSNRIKQIEGDLTEIQDTLTVFRKTIAVFQRLKYLENYIAAKDQKDLPDEYRCLSDKGIKAMESRIQNEIFMQTRCYQKAQNVLENERVVMIQGYTGDGKSLMAYNLAFDLLETQKVQFVVALNDPDQWTTITKENQKQVIIVDNMLGKYGIDDYMATKWRDFLQGLTVLESKTDESNMYLIITMQIDTFQSLPCFENFEFFQKITCINITLTNDEKQRLLTYHNCKIKNEASIKKIINSDAPGFPLLCHINCAMKMGVENVFSLKPKDVLRHIIEQMKSESCIDFLSLMFILLNECEVSLEKLDCTTERQDNIISDLENVYKKTLTRDKIIKSLKSMNGTYIRATGIYTPKTSTEILTLYHDTVAEALMCRIWEDSPNLAIRYCALELLFKRFPLHPNQIPNCQEEVFERINYELVELIKRGSTNTPLKDLHEEITKVVSFYTCTSPTQHDSVDPCILQFAFLSKDVIGRLFQVFFACSDLWSPAAIIDLLKICCDHVQTERSNCSTVSDVDSSVMRPILQYCWNNNIIQTVIIKLCRAGKLNIVCALIESCSIDKYLYFADLMKTFRKSEKGLYMALAANFLTQQGFRSSLDEFNRTNRDAKIFALAEGLRVPYCDSQTIDQILQECEDVYVQKPTLSQSKGVFPYEFLHSCISDGIFFHLINENANLVLKLCNLSVLCDTFVRSPVFLSNEQFRSLSLRVGKECFSDLKRDLSEQTEVSGVFNVLLNEARTIFTKTQRKQAHCIRQLKEKLKSGVISNSEILSFAYGSGNFDVFVLLLFAKQWDSDILLNTVMEDLHFHEKGLLKKTAKLLVQYSYNKGNLLSLLKEAVAFEGKETTEQSVHFLKYLLSESSSLQCLDYRSKSILVDFASQVKPLASNVVKRKYPNSYLAVLNHFRKNDD